MDFTGKYKTRRGEWVQIFSLDEKDARYVGMHNAKFTGNILGSAYYWDQKGDSLDTPEFDLVERQNPQEKGS